VADVAPIVVFKDMNCAYFRPAADDRDLDGASGLWRSEYWRARERAERAAAKRARSPAARGVHQELAQEYAARVRLLERDGGEPSTGQR
jgi:hypothetical protein